MSRAHLSDEIIAARMVELRNLRRLHARDRAQIAALKADNKALRAENAELRQLLTAAQAQIQTQAIQIAELQTMVNRPR
jgi:regulator of replication initiation timing